MQMTVNREQLIEALTEKRAEVSADLEKHVEKLRKDAEAGGTAQGDWLRQIAEMVDKGERFVYGQASGGGYFQFPPVDAIGVKVRQLPRCPVAPHHEGSTSEQLKYAEADLADAVAPYDAALKLLNMSSDAEVGIDAGDYHGLLGGTPRKARRRGK